ncbi:MAG: GGDEF domain-containing protein, partial [Nitrospirae bacterium]|nr:GGDEF domain-containing protein [Nitrospirota bacterium]
MNKNTEHELLARLATYIILLAWIILGLYIFDALRVEGIGIVQYFLSLEESGVRFRALILLAPFILTVIGHLVNERVKLLKKTLGLNEELEEKVKTLKHVAFYDELTDLHNRTSFLDRLRASMARANRQKDYIFAVLFMDLDRFKNINDSLGHAAGDQLLIEVASRLKKNVRPYDAVARFEGNYDDTVARFGGDEFGVILSGIKSVRDVARVAERLHN